MTPVDAVCAFLGILAALWGLVGSPRTRPRAAPINEPDLLADLCGGRAAPEESDLTARTLRGCLDAYVKVRPAGSTTVVERLFEARPFADNLDRWLPHIEAWGRARNVAVSLTLQWPPFYRHQDHNFLEACIERGGIKRQKVVRLSWVPAHLIEVQVAKSGALSLTAVGPDGGMSVCAGPDRPDQD